jgi:hypothetical protein
VGGDTSTLNHPLAKPARTEDWRILEGRFGEVYTDDPRPPSTAEPTDGGPARGDNDAIDPYGDIPDPSIPTDV